MVLLVVAVEIQQQVHCRIQHPVCEVSNLADSAETVSFLHKTSKHLQWFRLVRFLTPCALLLFSIAIGPIVLCYRTLELYLSFLLHLQQAPGIHRRLLVQCVRDQDWWLWDGFRHCVCNTDVSCSFGSCHNYVLGHWFNPHVTWKPASKECTCLMWVKTLSSVVAANWWQDGHSHFLSDILNNSFFKKRQLLIGCRTACFLQLNRPCIHFISASDSVYCNSCHEPA